jgi:acyl-CoA synthetase (AMP-forming)/AMP-acid ligase II
MPIRPHGAQLNIANGIREFAIASPNAYAVIDGERRLTYAALNERSSRLANALLAYGLRPTDRVAVMLANRLEYLEISCGIAKAGMVSVPVNPRLTMPEVEYILGHSASQAVVVDKALLGIVHPAIQSHGIRRIIAVDGDYEETLAGARSGDPRIDVDETEPFTVCYTAGTTGKPKGVVISHRSRSLSFYCTALEWGLGPGKLTLGVAPMYHGAGFLFAYVACHTGGTVALMRNWDPELLLQMVAEHRPSSVFLVPAHVQGLRAIGDEVIRKHDTSTLRTIYTNAAPMPQELKVWTVGTFPEVGLYEIYGSTEASIVTCLRPPTSYARSGALAPRGC